MFGLDGLFSGIMNTAGTILQNNAAAERQREANEFNAGQAAINRQFQSTEAATAREFNAGQSQITRDYNAMEAEKSRNFTADQASQANSVTEYLQNKAQAFNAGEAEKNRNFQQQMSSTAYQRAAADLQAAGLNRILAVGSPSSSPSGSAASISGGSGHAASGTGASAGAASGPAASGSATSGASAAPVANMFTAALSSAAEYERLKPQIAQIEAGTDVLKEDREKRAQEVQKTHHEKNNAFTAGKILEEELKQAKREGYRAETDFNFMLENPKLFQASRAAHTLATDVAPVVSTARQFMGMMSQRPF